MKRVLLGLAASLTFAAPAQATDYVVTGTADNAGICEGTTCTSLRQAINSSNLNPDPDTISVPEGLVVLTNGVLQISTPITITGAGANLTTVRGDVDGGRVLEVTAAASLNALTLEGGNAPDVGGSLLAQDSTVTLNRVRVTGGSAQSGGAIANLGGTLNVNQSLVDHGAATQGDAAGGGIANLGSTAFGSAALNIVNSTVAFNTARVGGGIVSTGDPGNTVTTTGVTIAQNHGNDSGGGVHIGAGTWLPQLTLVADNFQEQVPSNCTGTDGASQGWNLETGDECGFTQGTDKRDVVDARLDTVLNTNGGPTLTLMLKPGSQALNIQASCTTDVDQRAVARPQGAGCDAGAFESEDTPSGPPVITAPAPDLHTRSSDLELAGTADPGANVIVYLGTSVVSFAEANAQGAWAATIDLPAADGVYTYGVSANGSPRTTTQVTVDRTAPATTITSGPSTSGDGSATFTYASNEPGAVFTCRLIGPGRDDNEVECPAGGMTYSGLPNGQYEFRVRARDRAGNFLDSASFPFTVAVAAPEATPVAAQPSPTPTPTVTATPTPQPEVDKTVVTRPTAGKVLIRLPGSSQFTELKAIDDLPLGTTIDARDGRVQVRFESEPGKVQVALFYGGMFQVRQFGRVLDLRLNEPLAACPKKKKGGKASAAQTKKKAKKRKLWGDGKGSFRTSGKYSAATVRGTRWLVEDSCAGTLTRVATGVVAVRHGRKTVLLRSGKKYLAKAR